jgi:hypothetical protein
MRKPDAAPFTARKPSLAADRRNDAPAELVCVALALALIVLVARIASIW